MNSDWMHPVLIEPTDTLFFRDSIPMSAGQGRGAGARLPLPSTLHEAVRASLFEMYPRTDPDGAHFRKPRTDKNIRLKDAEKVSSKGSTDYQSLQLAGPLPYLVPRENKQGGLYFPLPLDLVFDEQLQPHTLTVSAPVGTQHSSPLPALALAPVPPAKNPPSGFISSTAMSAYLAGTLSELSQKNAILKQGELFEPEYRISVALDTDKQSAAEGQLFAATHARPSADFRLAAWMGLKKPRSGEADRLSGLDFLLLGGERRLARMHRKAVTLPVPTSPPIPESATPCLLKWVLATPAVFAHGWLPGWCRDSRKDHAPLPDLQVCLPLPGRTHLIAACLGKPLAFAGWDTVEQGSKPTQLAIPAGSVYYFLCENTATAQALADKIHWHPRSDIFGEKGFGYGFATTAPMSPDILELSRSLFPA